MCNEMHDYILLNSIVRQNTQGVKDNSRSRRIRKYQGRTPRRGYTIQKPRQRNMGEVRT